MVWSDLSMLTSLSPRDRTAGLGEVLKHALLEGEAAVAAIERDAETLFSGSPAALRDVVTAAIAFKANVVGADPRERQRAKSGQQATGRITLNLGHTIGHGLETASHHVGEPLRHGEAILLGLHAEAILGARQGLWPEGPDRLARLLPRLGLKATLRDWEQRLRSDAQLRDVVKTAMTADKKKEHGGVRFVLLSDGPGACREVLLDAKRALEIWLSENAG
jgi:3-dehydroquinate synthetase